MTAAPVEIKDVQPGVLYIDSRVGSGPLEKHFPATFATQIAQMEFGDFAFSGNGPEEAEWLIGVERKTISDFVSSMYSGRFQSHQLPGLVSAYNVVYLIVEGMFRFDIRDGRVKVFQGDWRTAMLGRQEVGMDGVIGAMNSIMCQAGVKLMTTSSERDTAAVLMSLVKWWGKRWTEHKSLTPATPIPVHSLHKLSTQEKVAMCLPGIGADKATKVCKQFPSIKAMVLADAEDWTQIEGVGKTIATKIVEAVNGR